MATILSLSTELLLQITEDLSNIVQVDQQRQKAQEVSQAAILEKQKVINVDWKADKIPQEIIDLKNLNLTCSTFRTIIAPRLFSTIYVSANERSINKVSRIGEFSYGSEVKGVVLLLKTEDVKFGPGSVEFTTCSWREKWNNCLLKLPEEFKDMYMSVIQNFPSLESLVVGIVMDVTLKEFLGGLNGVSLNFFQSLKQVLRDGLSELSARREQRKQAELGIQSLHGCINDTSRVSNESMSTVSHMSLRTDAEELRFKIQGSISEISWHTYTRYNLDTDFVSLDFLRPSNCAPMTSLILNSSTYNWPTHNWDTSRIGLGGNTTHLRHLQLRSCLLPCMRRSIGKMIELREVVMMDRAAISLEHLQYYSAWTEWCESMCRLPNLRSVVIKRSNQEEADEIVAKVTGLLDQEASKTPTEDNRVRGAARMFVYCSASHLDELGSGAHKYIFDPRVDYKACAEEIQCDRDMTAWQKLQKELERRRVRISKQE